MTKINLDALPALEGTEKQVSWAEDIRAGYAALLPLLEEAAMIWGDCRQEEKTVPNADPLNKSGNGSAAKVMRYIADTTIEQELAEQSVGRYLVRSAQLKTERFIQPFVNVDLHYRMPKHDGPHGWRLDHARATRRLAQDLEQALKTQTSAKHWIECREKSY